MKRFILITLLLISTGLYANESQGRDFENAIGLRFSNISGYGLSYRRQITENYYAKATASFYYYEYKKGHGPDYSHDEKNVLYDYGLEIQRALYKNENAFVYALLGTYVSKDEDKEIIPGMSQDTNKFEDKMAIGLGFGLEYDITSRFAINADIAYKYDTSDKEDNGEPILIKRTTIGLGLGLSYKF